MNFSLYLSLTDIAAVEMIASLPIIVSMKKQKTGLRIPLLVTPILLLLTLDSVALGVECGDQSKTWVDENGGYIDICPRDDQSVDLFAYARGRHGHTCNMETTAMIGAGKYTVFDSDCEVTLLQQGKDLMVTFSTGCQRSFCGMKGSWRSGLFRRRL